MKKFFSLCLMSMAVATISAQNQNLPFTVDPEPGSTLEQIESVTLTLNSEYDLFDVNDNDAIHFNFNGESFCNVYAKASYTEGVMVISPKIPILQYGEYELVIPAGAISWMNAESMPIDNEEDIVFSYTIGFGGDDPVSGDYPFFVDPTPGSVIGSLDKITLSLDVIEGEYVFMDIEIPEELYVTRNGERLPIGINVVSEEGEILYLTLDTPITEPGDYEVVIPAYAIYYEDGDEMPSENEEAIVLNYIVGQTEPPFTVFPAPGSEVESLEAVKLTVTKSAAEEGYEYFQYEDGFDFYFNRNGEHFCGTMATDSEDFFSVIITPSEPITEAGEYELVIPAYTLQCTNDDYEPFYVNEEDLIYKYIVTGVVEPAGPVEYDVVPTGYNPKEGEINLEDRFFNGLTINVPEGILPAEDAYIQVIPVGYEDEVIEALLTKVKYMNQVRAEWDDVDYNGDYKIIIPAGSFGDEAWLSDPETGHTNAEIVLNYTLVGGYERESAISYTLVPEVTWNEDLTIFTLVFEEETFLSKYAPFATLAGVNVSYGPTYTTNIVDNGNSTFTITFAEAPTEDGTYLFTVDKACFGDAEFIESDEEAGVANAEISIKIDITPTAIKAINADNVKAGVYNLYGVKVADSTNNLPAGIYIVNGKKVVVK